MHSISMRLVLFLCLSLAAFAGRAAEYPERFIKTVVPMAAGGATDVVARVFAQKMSARLGQNVVVENHPGAGGQIGAEFAAFAPADGYTMLFTSSSALTLPYLRQTRFELLRDFVAVGQVGVGNFALVINPKLPYKTLEEFLAAAKANPGKFTFGSAGVGAAGHLAGELFKAKTGIDMVHVPFKSSGEISQALISGMIDSSFDVLTMQKPKIESQVVRALASTGAERDPNLPNLPTVTESNLVPGGYQMTYWFGVFLPAKTPPRVVERVRREFAAVMKDPEILDRVKRFSLIPSQMTPEQFQANIEAESGVWKKVIAALGIEGK